jgi:hypothetical protein
MGTKTRRERYLEHRDAELRAARDRYNRDKTSINADRRARYAQNIDIERAKTRERVAKSRARNKHVSKNNPL